jgi:hypothetical protein
MILDTEAALIDSYRPQTDYTSPVVTQSDNPGEDLSTVGGTKLSELPDPAVGGQNGSRDRNGYSTGFRPRTMTQQPFTGAMAKPPAITNAVVGNVGQSNRASRLYAGVMNQLTYYEAQPVAVARAYVGRIDDRTTSTKPDA